MMNLPLTGGCHCGSVRYEILAEPILMVKCHCRDCQQISGGPYVPAIIFPHESFRLTRGEIRRYASESESGGENIRGFCEVCGSRLTGVEDEKRGIIGVLASSLDDPSIFDPRSDIYTADAQPWDLMDPGIAKFPGMFA